MTSMCSSPESEIIADAYTCSKQRRDSHTRTRFSYALSSLDTEHQQSNSIIEFGDIEDASEPTRALILA